MNTCEICKDREGITKLNDNTIICYTCYKNVWTEIFKSDFNKQECISTLKFLSEYTREVNSYIEYIKQDYNVYDNIRETEQVTSLKMFNKYRCTLKKNEHLKLIKYLRGVLKINFNKDIISYNVDYKARYLLGCNYLEV